MTVVREIINRGHFGAFSDTSQLPNVEASPHQVNNLRIGDVALVGSVLYSCLSNTQGAATWAPEASQPGGGGQLRSPVRFASSSNETALESDLNGTIIFIDNDEEKTLTLSPTLGVGFNVDTVYISFGGDGSDKMLTFLGPDMAFIGPDELASGGSASLRMLADTSTTPANVWQVKPGAAGTAPPPVAAGTAPPPVAAGTYTNSGRWTPLIVAAQGEAAAYTPGYFSRIGKALNEGASAAGDLVSGHASIIFTILDSEILDFTIADLPAGIFTVDIRQTFYVQLDSGTDIPTFRVQRIDESTMRVVSLAASAGGCAGTLEVDLIWEADAPA